MLACLLTFLNTCIHRRLNCLVITVDSNHPKSHASHPLNFHRLFLVNSKFKIYQVEWISYNQCHYNLPSATKNHQADYPPATYWPYMVNFQLHFYFPRWGWWVVMIKLNVNLSSTGTGLNWNWSSSLTSLISSTSSALAAGHRQGPLLYLFYLKGLLFIFYIFTSLPFLPCCSSQLG